MPKPIAFATDTQWANLTPDDQLAQAALASLGIEVRPAVWHDAALDWTQFAAVILRSTWDYHVRPAEFAEWLNRLEAQHVPVWNPIDVIRWNMNKRYLAELQGKGVRIAPSLWIKQGEQPAFGQVSNGWARTVLKPLLSANAHNTWIIENEADWEAKLSLIHKASDAVAQEFMGEVQTQGEWSLIFFDGEFSHAALKTPKAGDFRTQMTHGGSTQPITPPADLAAQARGILAKVDSRLLYARVDGVVRSGDFYLMELELIEPFLFLKYDAGAPERFARVVERFTAEVR
jgi:glutathione synthase/RimK-type ligase-like ATP-grasp enzyme